MPRLVATSTLLLFWNHRSLVVDGRRLAVRAKNDGGRRDLLISHTGDNNHGGETQHGTVFSAGDGHEFIPAASLDVFKNVSI